MSKSSRIPAVLAVALCAVPAWSQFTTKELKAAQQDPAKFTIDESSIKIERVGPTVSPADIAPPQNGGGAGDGLVVLDQIINTFQKLWKIIEDNKPVVDVKTQYAAALPKGINGWQDMAGWQPPRGTIYDLTAKNAYGMQMVRVRYQVLRTYGGGYNGRGKYLTAVTVEPLLVETGWGYHLSLDASVPDSSVVNVGSSENPVAGMMATLNFHISTAIKDSQGKGLYFLQGDGLFKEVGGPFSSRSLEKAKASVATLKEKTKNFD